MEKPLVFLTAECKPVVPGLQRVVTCTAQKTPLILPTPSSSPVPVPSDEDEELRLLVLLSESFYSFSFFFHFNSSFILYSLASIFFNFFILFYTQLFVFCSCSFVLLSFFCSVYFFPPTTLLSQVSTTCSFTLPHVGPHCFRIGDATV